MLVDTAPDALARAAELVKKGSVGPWGPAAPELAKLAEGALEREAEREPGGERWAELAAAVFAGDRAAANAARRFRESAYVFWKQGREADARACLAAASCFGDVPVLENPVAAVMAEVMLSPALAALRSRSSSVEEA